MVWNCVNKSWSGKRRCFCQSSLSQICVSDCVDFMWGVVGVGVVVGRCGGLDVNKSWSGIVLTNRGLENGC